MALILNVVQNKLKRLLSNVTEHSPDQLERALSNPEAERVLQRGLTDGSISLVDPDSKSPVYQRQMSQIGEQGYRVVNASPDASDLAACERE